MSKRTVTTSVRRIMRATGVPTPKAARGERTEAEKAVSRAQGSRKPKADMMPCLAPEEAHRPGPCHCQNCEAKVWAMAFGGDAAPEPKAKRTPAPLPVIPATPPMPVVTAYKAQVSNVKAADVAKAEVAVTVAPGGSNDVTHLGELTPGVALIWDKAGKPTPVTYAGRDQRGRVAVTETGANGNLRLMALPAWLLTRKGA